MERRKHLEQQRLKESDKLSAVAERRKALENADRQRKEAMLRKAQEREESIAEKRRERERRMHFAFGSSTPRSLHPTMGSTNDIWGASRRWVRNSCRCPVSRFDACEFVSREN